jgi:predicted nucleic acid-binding protein
MRRGLDTNVLIYAHMSSLQDHGAVRSYLLNQLSDPEIKLVLTAGVLHEFVHVVTDERRFQPAVSMEDALKLARLYVGRKNIEIVDSDEASLLQAFDLLERHGLGRKRIADTLFAATLLRNGVSELITCNLADFRIFEELHLIDPRVVQPATRTGTAPTEA